MNAKQFRNESSALIENGFARIYPPWDVRGDESECAKTKCDNCGHCGMEYCPYYSARHGYKPFRVCPKCGWAEEM